MTKTSKYELLKKLETASGVLSLSPQECALIKAALNNQQDIKAQASAISAKNETLEADLRVKEARLQHALTDANNLRHSLDALYNSTSWKFAAPLRTIKDAFARNKTARRSPAAVNTPQSTQQKTQENTSVRLRHKTQATPIKPSQSRPEKVAQPTYVARDDISISGPLPAALYAFYLPQFHPIKENNEWWGEGFTEWTNVRPAKPLYKGHYQPHEPDPNGDLGYYDLRHTSEVMRKQIKLAQQYGVEGFCFYFYWFGGERLLEAPLLNLLADEGLDVPFCLCWANENWSRRWDGRDDDVLMAQNNTPEDDLAFISYIAKYLKDARYRRIDGKPLLIVYRPIELPDPKATAKRWRNYCRENGIGEIYLAYTQSFENNDPRDYGFDGAIEFPPNNSAPPDLTQTVSPLSEDFAGKVYDWDIFPTRSDNYSAPDYPLFRSVCPAWDNTARRKQGGTVFEGSTPARYQHWLANALIDSEARIDNPRDRLIFINAWNEWAEGAHLEPDARHGHAYLAATRAALLGHKTPSPKKIVLVTHDALYHGAQILTLNLAREMSSVYGYDIDLVALNGGPLMDAYAETAVVHSLEGHAPDSKAAYSLAAELKVNGSALAICNTTVTGPFARALKDNGFQVVSLIHELTSVIAQYDLQDAAKDVAAYADKIVFPAKLVQTAFETETGPLSEKAVICPQGAYKVNQFRSLDDIASARETLRKHLGLGPTTRILLGVGYADPRKGFDLFLDIARALPKDRADIVCLWLGHQEPWVAPELVARMDALQKEGRLILPGRVEDTDPYYAGADVFMLTSREDPYPSTVLEALDVGLPVVGFDGVTGSTDLIAEYGGLLVPPFDTAAMTAAALRALVTTGDQTRADNFTRFRARADISFRGYAHDLLALAEAGPAQVSAVVPNYNYAHYLKDRVASIKAQTHVVREIIILDDSSSDNSLDVISTLCADTSLPTRFIPNTENSGSVFAQWLKGVEAARSEFVWIAEADDLALPTFLECAMAGFVNDDVILSYTQSSQMSEDGRVIDETYLSYVSDIDPSRWTQNYHREAATEIAQGLSIKNSIPNVSAVVFRRGPLLRVLREHMDHIRSYRVAGDWAAYVHLLSQSGEQAKVSFHAEPLNLHRRHNESVTLAKFGEAELDEIARMQAFAAQTADVSPAHKAKAAAYLDVLRAQFGLEMKDAVQ